MRGNNNTADFFERLRDQLAQSGAGQSKIAREAGVQQASLSRFMAGAQPTLNGDALVRLIGWLGGSIEFGGGEPDRSICFVNARQVNAAEGATPPQAEDYTAAPLVGEVGAGPGFLPEEEILSWFLVYNRLPAIRYRKNLIAVQLGPASTSMQPTLSPGDIVLVDRDDRDVTRPGHMMLVLDPLDGSGMIKRVSVQEKKDDFQITYYSDNASKWPPLTYSLNQDFGGDWDKSVAGRVIWAWADVREK